MTTIDWLFDFVRSPALYAALLGAVIGAAGASAAVRKSARVDLTLRLYDEFVSPQMQRVALRARAAVDAVGTDFIVARSKRHMAGAGGGLIALRGVAEVAEPADFAALVHLLTFFEKLVVLHEAGRLDTALVRGILGHHLRGWSEGVILHLEDDPGGDWHALLANVRRVRRLVR